MTSRWTLTIEFERAFHAGSGHALAGRLDRAIVRDTAGKPYLPGSTLKGKLRHASREIAHVFNERICGADRACLPDAPVCAICRMFGSAFRSGAVYVSDARADYDENPGLAGEDPVVWGERMGVSINRKTGTAEPKRLYSYECASALKLRAVVEGELGESELLLLSAAAKALFFFGGGSSRGLGHCKCRLT